MQIIRVLRGAGELELLEIFLHFFYQIIAAAGHLVGQAVDVLSLNRDCGVLAMLMTAEGACTFSYLFLDVLEESIVQCIFH